MCTFHLQIAAPDGLCFDGQAEYLCVRTINGDVGILKGHADYIAPVGAGTAYLKTEQGDTKTLSCTGGFLSVKNDKVRLLTQELKWLNDFNDRGH